MPFVLFLDLEFPMTTHHDKERQEAMDVAESAREQQWSHPSFAASLFAGAFDPDLVFPYPEQPEADRAKGEAFAAELERFLLTRHDAETADRDGVMPQDVIDGLIEMGAFALKIPEKYGGKGFSQANYNRVVSRAASYCASTAVWLSAHQSIGVPNPLKMFGNDEQKARLFPRLANGELSAFALTEPGVGSDPAKMETHAVRSPDGKGWLISGKKLWCTNGPIADILIVMARTPSEMVDGREKKRITAFIVERAWKGISVEHRCQFMGLRSIQNGVLVFENVFVPDENVLWGEGKGLKLALITLNSGRLTLPACCSGVARSALRIARIWAKERVQWGAPIGKHEAVAQKLAFMASHSFAMDSITEFATALVDRGDADVRLEAAMAKLFCSVTLETILNELVQTRGGRGFEESQSLRARGETPWPVERMYRDARINTIVEGTTEILHLFLAREALDFHLSKAGDLVLKKLPFGQMAKIAAKCAAFYPFWFVKQFLPGGKPLPDGVPSALAGHLAFVRKTAKKLARTTFVKMLRHGPTLERRELLLNRVVDVGIELTVMSATCARATMMLKKNPNDASPAELADLFCRMARRRIAVAFDGMSDNDDRTVVAVANGVLEGRYAWQEYGFIDPLAREEITKAKDRGTIPERDAAEARSVPRR
jgi:alkylation response protein AidB-like acyl-CoA dehydrogenase